MNKFLKWFTREREEVFFGLMLIIGMLGAAVYAMEITHHPIHIELDHHRMEEAYDDMQKAEAEKGYKEDTVPENKPPIIEAFDQQDEINKEALKKIDFNHISIDIMV